MDNDSYQGIWLPEGPMRGKPFEAMQPTASVPEAIGSSKPASPDKLPTTLRVRHAVVERRGGPVNVWAPETWTEEQIIEALDGLEASDW